jgi:hypothetical protein
MRPRKPEPAGTTAPTMPRRPRADSELKAEGTEADTFVVTPRPWRTIAR